MRYYNQASSNTCEVKGHGKRDAVAVDNDNKHFIIRCRMSQDGAYQSYRRA